jgi:hypothetical protein
MAGRMTDAELAELYPPRDRPIGPVGSRLRDPNVMGFVIVVVVMGIVLAFSRSIPELGLGAR